jgi:predicted kinase
MKNDLSYILTLASALISTVAALFFSLATWKAAKRDRLLSKEYKVHVGKLMIELRRDYANRLKSRKSENLSSQP